MRQNAFGGRAQPGPAEGASALPQTSEPQLGGGLPTYHGEGREGMGKGKEGDGKREREDGNGREGGLAMYAFP